MKRFFVLMTILAALMVSTTPVRAARSRARTVNRPQRTGIFARLMELERRKNAAIRRMLGWD